MRSELSLRKIRAATVSVVSNVCITIAKVIAALLSGSVSVLSEALHSVGDILASVFAWISVRIADKPADEGHPFGHGKVEPFAGFTESLLLVAAAVWVGYEAIVRFSRPEPIAVDIALAVIVCAAIANVFVGRYLYRTAEETDSDALRADAAHIKADVLTSAGVVIALLLVKATGNPIWDPIIALILSLWILFTAIRIARNAVNQLMDIALPQSEVDAIESILKSDVRVRGYHQLRTRKMGSHRHVDAHILLDDELSLIEAHDITEQIEDKIRRALDNVSISLHMEPHQEELRHRREQHSEG